MSYPGSQDLLQAIAGLAETLPQALAPLARIAYNLRWAWDLNGPQVFAAIDPHRWELSGHNPVRLLREADPRALRRAAGDRALLRRINSLARVLEADSTEGAPTLTGKDARPVAFLCAEFAVHQSLPIYAGGLGVLAGDLLKEASDQGFPMIGVGLMYRHGYLHQRIDRDGWQHEYWTDTDPERLPAVLLTRPDGSCLTVEIPIFDRVLHARLWRVEVGRAPLYLLDTQVPESSALDRWVGDRLYVGTPEIRLSQYAVLGLGAVRALQALAIEPRLLHLNEGHAALAALELLAQARAAGASLAEAIAAVRRRVVFTTHTPVAAGNESYSPAVLLQVLAALPGRLGLEREAFLDLFRMRPGDSNEAPGMTPLAIRLSRSVNGVSRRHAQVAGQIWAPLLAAEPGRLTLRHVTNGVHLPSWMAPTMQRLLDHYLPAQWRRQVSDGATWKAVAEIPDAALWRARQAMKSTLVQRVRDWSVVNRLCRGDSLDYVQAATTFSIELPTMGFARRLAVYKRLHLLIQEPRRALALLERAPGLQLVLAGKAHPQDDEAKRIVHRLFELKGLTRSVGQRVAFVEDHDLAMAAVLVSGCDFWVNLPRPPQEASGTSGMKAALNGLLNLSVLDGWWAEAYQPGLGWAIGGAESQDYVAQDASDAAALYDLVERQVLPLYLERDADGLPQRWLQMVRSALSELAPRFSASRMLEDYAERIYAAGDAGS